MHTCLDMYKLVNSSPSFEVEALVRHHHETSIST